MAYCKRVDTQRITACAAAVLANLFKLPAFGKERGGAMRVLAGCHACFSVIFLVFNVSSDKEVITRDYDASVM